MQETRYGLKVEVAVATLLLIAVTGAIARAQPRDPEAAAQRIFTSVMSPYCPGLLLADCPSPAAFELRAQILRRLEAGESAADIERDLYREFGDSIRAVPAPRGLGAVLWIAPALVLGMTLAVLLTFLARVRPLSRPDEPIPNVDADPRLQDELDRLSEEA
jgi:cytochrome c-type biogenesis protein CcmH